MTARQDQVFLQMEYLFIGAIPEKASSGNNSQTEINCEFHVTQLNPPALPMFDSWGRSCMRFI